MNPSVCGTTGSLRHAEARYVARLVSWVLTVEGHPAYYLSLRDWHDLHALIDCLSHPDHDSEVGHEGDLAGDLDEDRKGEESERLDHVDLNLFVGTSFLRPVTLRPGITAPLLIVDQLCSYNREHLIKWFGVGPRPSPKGKGAAQADASPERFLRTLVQTADNMGDTDEWRALNFLAVNYPPLYEKYAEMAEQHYILDSVKVYPSRLWREKRIVDPVFTFLNTQTSATKKYFVRVEVTHLFPVLVNHLAEFFDR